MIELVKQFIDYLVLAKCRSNHTAVSYQTDLLSFVTYAKQEYNIDVIGDVNHLIIRSWIAELKINKLSNASVNRKISTLKSFYKYLKRKEIISSNPMIKVQTLKMAKKLPSFVTEKKMVDILGDSIQKYTFSNLRDQLIIQLLYFTGMRRSELIGLQFCKIDFERNELKVLGKGNKERSCILDDSLKEILNRYKTELQNNFEDLEHDFVIVTDKGKPAYPKFIYNKVSYILKLNNASDKASPHVLRHTFATHLMSQGAELNAVKELLGHASLAATQVYTHNTIDRLKLAYKNAHPKA